MEIFMTALVAFSLYSFIRSIHLHDRIDTLKLERDLARSESKVYFNLAIKYKKTYEETLRQHNFRPQPRDRSKSTWKTAFGLPEHGQYEMKFVTEKYYDLLKKNHPDKGGSNKRMAEINAAYDEAKKELQ